MIIEPINNDLTSNDTIKQTKFKFKALLQLLHIIYNQVNSVTMVEMINLKCKKITRFTISSFTSSSMSMNIKLC
jgi:hypothetical protein